MFWSLLFFFFFEMRPSCSPWSFLLVAFQECSLVLSMTKSLGACWRSLPGERNINSRVFSTKLFTKSEASFLSCQCLFHGITLKISLSDDPSLLWSNCKQQSWAVLSPLLYVKISPWAQATLPFLRCPIHPFPLFYQLLFPAKVTFWGTGIRTATLSYLWDIFQPIIHTSNELSIYQAPT